jgi:hypothetical protein
MQIFWIILGFRIRDVYPGYRILIFIHPRSRGVSNPRFNNSNKIDRGGGEFVVTIFFFFFSHKYKKNFWVNHADFRRNILTSIRFLILLMVKKSIGVQYSPSTIRKLFILISKTDTMTMTDRKQEE